jgi:transglutaminase-like putative cysteine protease
MLRMFDFIVLAQAKIAGLVDSSKSTETPLEEKDDGTWAYVKVASLTVFKRPFLGQDSLRSVQAVHLRRSGGTAGPAPSGSVPGATGGGGWLIVEMEELESEASPVRLRTGLPEGGAPASRDLFPVSRHAPAKPGLADRLRLRLRLKNGEPLAGFCRLGPDQALVRAISPSEWILENRRLPLHPPPAGRPAALPPDTLRTYLASNGYLILEDSLLAATAAGIAPGETDPGLIAGAVYRWVAERFRFRLGAVLFGTSAGILRDLTGDCSEAAVLTAALLRARKVPARIALGFASLGRGVFIGHAWCEARLEGGWTGVDAALREFPAGVERVRLSELDGRADMRIAATNLMMGALANLEIEILGAWKGGNALRLEEFPDNSAEAGRFFEEILRGVDEGAEDRRQNEK